MTQIPVLTGTLPTPEARGRAGDVPGGTADATSPAARAGSAWATAWAQSAPREGAPDSDPVMPVPADAAMAPVVAARLPDASAPVPPGESGPAAMPGPSVRQGTVDPGIIRRGSAPDAPDPEADLSVGAETADRGGAGVEAADSRTAPVAVVGNGAAGPMTGVNETGPVDAVASEGARPTALSSPIPTPIRSEGTGIRAEAPRRPVGGTAAQGLIPGERMSDMRTGPDVPAVPVAASNLTRPEGALRPAAPETTAGGPAANAALRVPAAPNPGGEPAAAPASTGDRSRGAQASPAAMPAVRSAPTDPASVVPVPIMPVGSVGGAVIAAEEPARAGSRRAGELPIPDPALPRVGVAGQAAAAAADSGAAAGTTTGAEAPVARAATGPVDLPIGRTGPVPGAAAVSFPGRLVRLPGVGAVTGAEPATTAGAVAAGPADQSLVGASTGLRSEWRMGPGAGSSAAPDSASSPSGRVAPGPDGSTAVFAVPPGTAVRSADAPPLSHPEPPRAARLRAVAAADPAASSTPPVAAPATVAAVPGLRVEPVDARPSLSAAGITELSAGTALFRPEFAPGVPAPPQDSAGSTGTVARHASASGDAPDPRAIAAQLGEAFVSSLPDGAVEISLRPEELGRVRMVLSPDAGSMTVTLTAERPETLDQMRRAIDTLAADLRDLGYAGLSFRFDRSGHPGGRQGRPAVEAPGVAEAAPAAAAERAAAGMAASLQLRTAARLDIRL